MTFGNLSSDLPTRVMAQSLLCTLRPASLMTSETEKIVSILHQKLEQFTQNFIPSMMLHVIGTTGQSLFVKLTRCDVIQQVAMLSSMFRGIFFKKKTLGPWGSPCLFVNIYLTVVRSIWNKGGNVNVTFRMNSCYRTAFCPWSYYFLSETVRILQTSHTCICLFINFAGSVLGVNSRKRHIQCGNVRYRDTDYPSDSLKLKIISVLAPLSRSGEGGVSTATGLEIRQSDLVQVLETNVSLL